MTETTTTTTTSIPQRQEFYTRFRDIQAKLRDAEHNPGTLTHEQIRDLTREAAAIVHGLQSVVATGPKGRKPAAEKTKAPKTTVKESSNNDSLDDL
jgi:hypothetical protein